jgi:hypothetical protein
MDTPSNAGGCAGIVTYDERTVAYQYHQRVLDELARHGLNPARHTPPERLRDAVRDLYKYEIRRLRSELLAGRIRKPDYAGHVIALRQRYWLLSIPTQLWLDKTGEGREG